MNSDHAPTAEEQSDVMKNIHSEDLPEGYRFSDADEARLDALDFYTHKGEIDNPPTDVTEADRFMAWRWYGQFLSPMRDDFLRSMAWRICRERQLLAALRENREKDARIAELTRERDHTWTQRNADLFAERNAAEAKLRAVSDALDEKPVTVFHVGELEYYLRSEIDAPLARIRAIAEGK